MEVVGHAAWGGGKLNATTILLEPLAAVECSELIGLHGRGEDDVRDEILLRAEGNPRDAVPGETGSAAPI